jgi:peroxiredoxin Q/BCP
MFVPSLSPKGLFMLDVGVFAPAFSLSDQWGNTVQLAEMRGKWVVLWWYPEAGTPGCTLQAGSLERSLGSIQSDGTVVLGASFDAPGKNNSFACDQSLGMLLLSDELMQAGQAYGVVRDPADPYPSKPLRHTFIIDPAGRVAFAEDASAQNLAKYGDHMVETLTQLKSNVT